MRIFTDVSVDPESRIGIGSYLFSNDLDTVDKHNIKYIKYDSTSSTMAELYTIGYVFNYLNLIYTNPLDISPSIYLYTDCRSFINLIITRRDTIKSTHRNYKLYKYLINTVEKFKINVVWTEGHPPKKLQIEKHQRIFSMVDKHARKTLRDIIKQSDNKLEEE